jgi:hypothetical protein
MNLLLTFLHGFALVAALAVGQLLLVSWQVGFLLYNPPIGFAFFVVAWYVVQPLLVGALDVIVLSRLFELEGCQTGSWLTGIFLLLAFGAVNIAVKTVWGLPFSVELAAAEVVLLAFPFGLLGKLTRTGFGRRRADS